MRLYYSIVDPYPAYRSDIAELFGVELRNLGLDTEWYMVGERGAAPNFPAFKDQVINFPCKNLSKIRIVSRFNYWLSDIFFILKASRKSFSAIQTRDKYIASLAAIFVSRFTNLYFFYWCSYPFPEQDELVSVGKKGFSRWLGLIKARARFFLLYHVICPLADHVFVQSERMKLDMHSYGIPLEKMTPVPMGVSARIKEWVKTNPVDVIPFRIVYLGTLAAVRRLDMLLDAFLLIQNQIPDAQLYFVGEGDNPSERQVLEQRATELGLRAKVIFTGFVPMEKAWELSASAAVCLSPFFPTQVLVSTSPTKLVEYLALGRPVVCNDHPEQSKIINESGAGLCVEWNSYAFASAILKLLLDPALAEKMAARGPAWVEESRTYPKIAKQVFKKYNELLSDAR